MPLIRWTERSEGNFLRYMMRRGAELRCVLIFLGEHSGGQTAQMAENLFFVIDFFVKISGIIYRKSDTKIEISSCNSSRRIYGLADIFEKNFILPLFIIYFITILSFSNVTRSYLYLHK
jgi:hypothetical protein